MSSKTLIPKRIAQTYPNKAVDAPKLVNVYRQKRKIWRPAVRSVADAPFGIQQATLLRVIGDNGKDGHFTFPLQKLVFNYCDLGGSSVGMR
jgi:hypothetical protein